MLWILSVINKKINNCQDDWTWNSSGHCMYPSVSDTGEQVIPGECSVALESQQRKLFSGSIGLWILLSLFPLWEYACPHPPEHPVHQIMLTQALMDSLYNSWRFLFFELIAEWPRFPFWQIHPVITFRSCYLLGLGVGSLTYFPFDPLYTGWLKMVYPSQAKFTVIGAPYSYTSNGINFHYCAA